MKKSENSLDKLDKSIKENKQHYFFKNACSCFGKFYL